MNLAILLVALAIAAAVALQAKKARRRGDDAVKPRAPLTNREQAMYHRLRNTLPKHIILAQVSLGALLTARSHAARNKFNQKIADFVVCTPAFDVIAVIELDDSSHKTKRDRDAARDAMLAQAGIRTIRYPHTPEADTLRRDITPRPPQPAPASQPERLTEKRAGTERTAAT